MVNSTTAIPPSITGSRSTHHRAARLLAIATSALAVILAILLGIWWRHPAYVMPFWVVGIGGLCASLTGIGGVMATRRGTVTPWLLPAGTLLLLLGFLVAGVLVLAPLTVALVLLAQSRMRRHVAPSTGWHGGAGLVLTLGLVPLCLLVVLRGPAVECMPNGFGGGTPIWAWLGSLGAASGSGIASGSVSSFQPNQTSGSVNVGDTTYAFDCVGSDLVNFGPATR